MSYKGCKIDLKTLQQVKIICWLRRGGCREKLNLYRSIEEEEKAVATEINFYFNTCWGNWFRSVTGG